VPFVKIVGNIAKYNLERTPFAALAIRQVRSDIASGGKARDMALSKMAVGGSMMLAFGALAFGGMVTGGGPSDPKKKKIWTDSGWQEYSVKIRGTWYSYKRLEPFATPIGVAADIMEMMKFAPDFGYDEAVLVGALSFVRNFTSKTYMQGMSDFLEAITSGGEDTMMASASKFGKGLPRILVPGGIAQIARVSDPTKREVEGWIDTLKNRIPGLSSTLEPQYNLKGDEITNKMYESLPGKGLGMINPITWSTDPNDPVWNEIRRLRVPVTMPARRIGGGSNPDAPQLEEGAIATRLSPKEYGWLVRMAGNGLKDPATGMGAWDALAAIVKGAVPVMKDPNTQEDLFYNSVNDKGQPVFSDGPEGGKSLIILKVIGKYRDAARRQLESGEEFPRMYNEQVIRKTKRADSQMPRISGGAR
jgi:hypothetical protein